MRKTILLALAGTAFLGNIIQAKSENTKFNGFYAGASVGYAHQITNIDAKQNPTNPNADVYSGHQHQGLPVAELFMGWGKMLTGYLYGGLEGKIDWASKKSHKMAEDTNFLYHKQHKTPGLAILARLGFLVSPSTLIYGGVGLKAVQHQYVLLEKAGNIPAVFKQKAINPFTEVGLETQLGSSQNLKVRFSYSIVPNSSMIWKSSHFPINHAYQEHGSFKVTGTEHAFKIGLLCHF